MNQMKSAILHCHGTMHMPGCDGWTMNWYSHCLRQYGRLPGSYVMMHVPARPYHKTHCVCVCVCVCLHKKDHRQPYQLNTGRTTSWLISRLAETHTYVDKQVYSSHVRFHGNQSVTNNFLWSQLRFTENNIDSQVSYRLLWCTVPQYHSSQDLACLYPLVVLETDPSLLF